MSSLVGTATLAAQKFIDLITLKACREPKETPLTPEDIVGVLEGRGWEAEIVKAADMEGMVDICPKGILKCVDGRGSDNEAMAGPKMAGGIYAIAHNRHTTSIEGLKAITKEVAAKGHVPSVHGDHSKDMMGVASSSYG